MEKKIDKIMKASKMVLRVPKVNSRKTRLGEFIEDIMLFFSTVSTLYVASFTWFLLEYFPSVELLYSSSILDKYTYFNELIILYSYGSYLLFIFAPVAFIWLKISRSIGFYINSEKNIPIWYKKIVTFMNRCFPTVEHVEKHETPLGIRFTIVRGRQLIGSKKYKQRLLNNKDKYKP